MTRTSVFAFTCFYLPAAAAAKTPPTPRSGSWYHIVDGKKNNNGRFAMFATMGIIDWSQTTNQLGTMFTVNYMLNISILHHRMDIFNVL